MVVGTIHLGKGYAKLEYDTALDILTIYWYNPSTGNYETKLRIKLSTGEILAVGDVLQDVRIKKTIPRLYLQGTESGGKVFSIREDSGRLVVRDESAGVDILNLAALIRLLLKSVSPPLGTGGSLGSAVSISPDTGYSRIIPQGVTIAVGGTLASGETITVRIRFNFDDGTSAYKDFSFTATGSYTLTESDLQSLWKNGASITSISVQVASSASSTSATVTVTVRGFQH